MYIPILVKGLHTHHRHCLIVGQEVQCCEHNKECPHQTEGVRPDNSSVLCVCACDSPGAVSHLMREPEVDNQPGQVHCCLLQTQTQTHTNLLTEYTALNLAVVFSRHVGHVVSPSLMLDQSSSCCHASSAHYGLCKGPQWLK